MQKLSKSILSSSALLLSLLFTPASFANQQKLEGVVTIDYEDYSDEQRSQLRYFVKDAKGKSTEILMDKQPNWLKTGQKVRLQGQANGKKFQAEQGTISLLQSDGAQSINYASSSLSQTISGERSVLVVEVHPPTYDVEMISAAMIEDTVFTQANQFFQEASYGDVSLGGDISAPIVVDYDTTACKTSDLESKADVELRNNGYEPNNYDHVMYLIPYYGKCSWAGKGNVGGPKTWIKQFTTRVVNHELGHNLGLFHSNKKDCGTQVTDGSSCTTTEYGDVISAMGSSNFTNHFNSFHKEQLGWLEGKVVTLSNDGNVTLSPFEENSNTPKALKVLKNTDSNGNKVWYYLEYRQAIGFDANLGDNYPHYLDGVRLREGTDNSANSSLLLDTTPASDTNESYDWYDISIHPGQTYSDNNNDLSISVIASDSTGVTLQVSYGGNGGGGNEEPVCEAATPSISSLSANATNIEAGENLSFNYRVTNNDSAECAQSSFDLSSSLPSGWTGSLSHSQLTLTAGASANFSLNTSVSSSANDGNYSLTVQALRGAQSVSASNNVQVVNPVTEPTNQAPVATSDLHTISSKSTTVIPVLNNDYDPENDSLSLVSATQGNKGSVSINSDGSITYSPSKRFKSSDSFSYTISDGELTSTTSVSIRLQATDDGGGSGGGGKGGGKGRK